MSVMCSYSEWMDIENHLDDNFISIGSPNQSTTDEGSDHPEASCDGRGIPPLVPDPAYKNMPPVSQKVPDAILEEEASSPPTAQQHLVQTQTPTPVTYTHLRSIAPQTQDHLHSFAAQKNSVQQTQDHLHSFVAQKNFVQQTQDPSQMPLIMLQSTKDPSRTLPMTLINAEYSTQYPSQTPSMTFTNSVQQTQDPSQMTPRKIITFGQQILEPLQTSTSVMQAPILAQYQSQQQLVAREAGCGGSAEEESTQLSPVTVDEISLPHTSQEMVMASVSDLQTTNTPQERIMVCSVPSKQSQHALILPQHAQVQSSSHMAPVIGLVDVPVLSDSEGEYGFQVTVEDKERTNKSPMWLMSRIANKLYTNINKAVPFEIFLKKPIDITKFSIRAVPVFSSPQFLRTNVNRCPNHAAPTDATNHDFPYPEHVVRADHPEARYVKSASGRLSVVVPLDTLQDGSEYTPILLRFMCLGSCVGGINRRPIAIIITLENSAGEVCGRKVIDVRVCACPTRDIKTDEQAVINRGAKRKGSAIVQEKVPMVTRKKPRTLEPKTEPQEDDDIFYIPVRGEHLYNFLSDMKATYLRYHPDYAAKYPNDNFPPGSISSRHTSEENLKERSGWSSSTDETEANTWDSEADSPHRLTYDDNHGDLFNDVSNTSSSCQVQSHFPISPRMKLMVVGRERNGGEHTGSVSIQTNDMKAWPRTTEAIVSSSQISPVTIVPPLSAASPELHSQTVSKFNIVHRPKVTSTKHVPVMQVSSYKPGDSVVRRSASEYKIGSRQPVSLSRSSSLTQKQYVKECAKLPPVKLGSDSSISREEQLSHGSPEMIAANVLVEGFAKEKKSINTK